MKSSEQARRLRSTWWKPASTAWQRGDDAGAYYRWIMAKYSMTRPEAVAYVAETQHHCGLISAVHLPRDKAAEDAESPAVARTPTDPVDRLLRGVRQLRNAADLHRVLHAIDDRWQALNGKAA
jgi:hypothetical protein